MNLTGEAMGVEVDQGSRTDTVEAPTSTCRRRIASIMGGDGGPSLRNTGSYSAVRLTGEDLPHGDLP